MADPEFLGWVGGWGGGANLDIYYWANICRKLHENERNWTGGGGEQASLALPWIYCVVIENIRKKKK